MMGSRRRKFKNEAKLDGDKVLKRCTVCGEFKDLKEFYKDPTKLFAVRQDCKPCVAKYREVYYEANKQEVADNWLKTQYNLSREELNNLIEIQENKCAICKNLMTGYKEPMVDHNHITGKVRGLLCANCNFGIGSLKESINILLE